jgi:hypothetical protein
MKKYYLYIIVLFTNLIHAQRLGESYLGFLGGYEKNGFTADVQLDINNYTGGIWRIATAIEPEKYTFRDEKIPVILYLGNIGYQHRLFSLDYQDRFIFRMGGGIIGGWEEVNKGRKYLDTGFELTQKSQTIYGINAVAEIEIYLFNLGHANQEVFLLLQGNYHYFFNSDVGNRQPTIKGGFKFKLGI